MAAHFTMQRLGVVPIVAAAFAMPMVHGDRLNLTIQFGTHDSRGHRDDGKTRQHHDRSQHFSQDRHRGNIPIADGCHRDDTPLNCLRNTREPGILHPALNDIHQGALDADNRHEAENEYGDLRPTRFHRVNQHVGVT